MLHEVLLALIGHTGTLIISDEEGKFMVNPKMNFLTEAEITLINRILSLGSLLK